MTQTMGALSRYTLARHMVTFMVLAALLAAALMLPIMHLTLWLEPAIRDVFAAAPGDIPISPDMIIAMFGGIGYDITDVRFTESYSVLGGIRALFSAGHWVPAVLLGLFSVVLPILKLGLRMLSTIVPNIARLTEIQGLLEPLTKWALLDVFAVAVLLLSLAMAPGTQTSVGPAFGVFLLYIALFVQSSRWNHRV